MLDHPLAAVIIARDLALYRAAVLVFAAGLSWTMLRLAIPPRFHKWLHGAALAAWLGLNLAALVAA